MKVFRLVGITMILVVSLCLVSRAADEPNFRAMGVPTEISICESTDLLSRLQLTGTAEAVANGFGRWKGSIPDCKIQV